MSSAGQIQRLNEGIHALGLDPDDHPVKAYFQYLDELARWNRAYNLTGIRELDAMVTHHILDSLSILPFITGPGCIDVGSGAGLPGVVLALARPELDWVLIDSKSKKVRFLKHVVRTLNPGNVEVVHGRAEQYQPRVKFDSVVSRAFSDLHSFLKHTSHLRSDGGKLLAMKGKIETNELDGILNTDYQVHKLQVPGIKTERNLVIING